MCFQRTFESQWLNAMTCDLRGQRILRVSTWVVSSENRGVSQFQWILIIFAIPTAILGVTPHLQMDPNLISSWLVASQCISIYFEKKVQKQLPNETPIYGIIYIYIYYVCIYIMYIYIWYPSFYPHEIPAFPPILWPGIHPRESWEMTKNAS